jgi:branched-subunit amino acid aminotransferase/4-amino-4-deoxychorismate lyase
MDLTYHNAQKNRDLGYFLFETMVLVHGHVVREAYHRERLFRSIHELKWPRQIRGQALESWWEDMMGHFVLEQKGEKRIRVKLLVIPDENNLAWELQFGKIPVYPHIIKLGYDVRYIRFSRDPFLRWKTGSWGQNLHALYHCSPRFDDIIFLNEKGELCETARANIFFLIEDELFTPPLSCGLLPGTMRQELLDCGTVQIEGGQVPVREKILKPQDVLSADSCWITNALMGLRKAELVLIP